MRLHSDSLPGANRITAYGSGFVAVNDERIPGSVVVTPERLVRDWPPTRVEDLDAAVPQMVVGLAPEPEIVLIGTGATHSFPAGEMLAAIGARGIGVEVMSTPAACRTYNILMAEGRRVAALLLGIE